MVGQTNPNSPTGGFIELCVSIRLYGHLFICIMKENLQSVYMQFMFKKQSVFYINYVLHTVGLINLRTGNRKILPMIQNDTSARKKHKNVLAKHCGNVWIWPVLQIAVLNAVSLI